MSRTIEIAHLADDDWTVDGERVTVPDGRPAQAFLLTYASERYPPGTVATLPTPEGGTRNITLRYRMGAAAPSSPNPAPAAAASTTATDLTDQPDPEPQPRRTRRRALMVILVVLTLLLALAAALILPRLAGPATDQEPAAAWRQTWATAPASGPITAAATQVAGAGVILNVDGGAVEAYSQADGGAFIGSALAPEGARIGVGPDFIVLATSTEGTSSGAVITPNGVTPFSEEPGALIRRGTVPFLAGGAGADQSALIYRNSQWERVETPTPGLAPLAVTESSVVWLGVGRTITLTDYSGSITSESTLETPESAVEATQRAFVTDSLIGVVWTSEEGNRELVTHSLTTGEILERAPVGVEVFDKIGAAITSTAGEGSSTTDAPPVTYWTLSENTPEKVTAECADPIPSGGTAWCSEGDTYTDTNGESLPAGTRPIPSTTDTTPAISGDQLALYSR